MTMRWLAVALVLSGCLAGCLEDDDAPAAPTGTGTGSATATTTTPPPPPQVLDLLRAFDLVGCSGMTVQHARPLEDVQALLPSGFTAVPPPGPGSPTTGALAIDLFLCGNLTTAAVAVPQVYVGLLYTYVARPVDRVPGAPDHPVQEYVFRLLSGDPVMATLWPAAGYDTYNGSAEFDGGPPVDDPFPDPFARVSQGSVGADYFLVASGANVAASPGARTQAFARYTERADDRSVLLWTGTYDFPHSAGGSGFMQVAPDDPFGTYATPQQRPYLAGTTQQYDLGNVLEQDLRRIFT